MSKQKRTKQKKSSPAKIIETKSEQQKPKLDSKTQLQVILFTILTFGVFYILLNIRLEKDKKKVIVSADIAQTLTTTTEIPFEVDVLIKHLGEAENIVCVDATLNSLKVEVIDPTKVNVDHIKKIGAKGILKNGNKISMIFGDYATHLQKLIPIKSAIVVLEEPKQVISDALDFIPDFHAFLENACQKPQIIEPVKITALI